MAKSRKEYSRQRRKVCCEDCGGPKEIGGYCKACWNKRTKRRKKLFAEKKARGECITCINKTENKSRCDECLIKQREQRKRRESKRFEKGLCVNCGKNKHTKHSKTCGNCFCRNVSKFHFNTYSKTEDLKNLLKHQNYICPYTGKKLILGETCTLDHILPKSRGGSNDMNNLQWVFCSEFLNVNTIKWSMTDEEFRTLIVNIFEHIEG